MIKRLHKCTPRLVCRQTQRYRRIVMNLTEKFTPDYLPPDQIIDEVFSNEYKESRERWATHFKILLQCRDIVLPCDREPFVQIVSIKRRVLPS